MCSNSLLMPLILLLWFVARSPDWEMSLRLWLRTFNRELIESATVVICRWEGRWCWGALRGLTRAIVPYDPKNEVTSRMSYLPHRVLVLLFKMRTLLPDNKSLRTSTQLPADWICLQVIAGGSMMDSPMSSFTSDFGNGWRLCPYNGDHDHGDVDGDIDDIGAVRFNRSTAELWRLYCGLLCRDSRRSTEPPLRIGKVDGH
ncbi:hypothetical protein BGW80DRAFT_1442396 [Lactifluus volemus]|nr:hypothetical protein BGW80DRAFT_1442396 [Lactifluus volemus]